MSEEWAMEGRRVGESLRKWAWSMVLHIEGRSQSLGFLSVLALFLKLNIYLSEGDYNIINIKINSYR